MAKRKAVPKSPPKQPAFPGFRDISVADYHRDHSAISKSMLWDFAKRRRVFEAKYVSKTLPDNPPTRSMEIGTLAHAGVLEPKTFSQRYAVYPDECLNKKGDLIPKKAEEFRQTITDGRIVVKPSEMETVQAMVRSVTEKLESWLALESYREQAIYWTEATTGLLCRCLCDWIIIANGQAFVLDLKTTGDAHPAKFAYKCEDYGYQLQDAHYGEGVSTATDLPVEFLFVVCESEFPHVTSIQKLSEKDAAAAVDYRRRLLGDLKACLDSGDFSEPWESDISPINLRPACYA